MILVHILLQGIFLLFLISLGMAAGSLPYGSRAGMSVTISEIENIDTENAIIRVRHTRENAREFCEDYVGDASESCIQRTLKGVRLADTVKANCKSGLFSNLNGENVIFGGANLNYDAAPSTPEYRIYKRNSKQFLDGSIASQYGVILEQFKALCPAAFGVAALAFANRPAFIGRWYIKNPKSCDSEQDGMIEDLLVYTTKEINDHERFCKIIRKTSDRSHFELHLSCNAEGFKTREREILRIERNKMNLTNFDSNQRPQTTLLTKCSK